MAELDALYMLTGPDGTTVSFGNSTAAPSDADWIGFLKPDDGITGLDGADVRESAADIIGGDGGIHYDFFHGRRPIAISGDIWPEGRDQEEINQWDQRLRRATNAMREDAVLSWENTGFPERQLLLRRQQPPRITGRRPKSFQVAMVSADYRIQSVAENDSGVNARGVADAVDNAGDETATPRFVLIGPLGGPIVVRNLTTGLDITFKPSFSLAGGETLEISTAPPYPIVQVDGDDRYDAIAYLTTAWWGLVPGSNNLRVDAASGAGTWRAFWRDAWI